MPNIRVLITPQDKDMPMIIDKTELRECLRKLKIANTTLPVNFTFQNTGLIYTVTYYVDDDGPNLISLSIPPDPVYVGNKRIKNPEYSFGFIG